jgi:hypothetical protein
MNVVVQNMTPEYRLRGGFWFARPWSNPQTSALDESAGFCQQKILDLGAWGIVRGE